MIESNNVSPLKEEIVDLKLLLEFKDDDVIDGFCQKYDVTRDDANTIFEDMLRFFWLSEKYNSELLSVIDHPILIIDKMWHTFILFTRNYVQFCNTYFGRYIHHAPTTISEKKEHKKKLKKEILQEKGQRYELIYEMLGKDIFIRWFLIYPDQYTKDAILKLRKY
ncbi:hypothetical protein [Pleionea sp. CnH1-48]|uniref:glycine-rich domain-containing protein n=1 Tax=Pleionea sp. CnH1-48 TaxID=2954494 RepID=UPI002096AF0E|nr:hypothetical protein [Pleionea sp. CnH1-48]MCO7224307.1 hypothetical protein [Pleionea sp. CnH1-48]